MGAKNINMKDYEVGQIGYWPTFTSTTKDKNVAFGFVNHAPKDHPKIMLKIYLSAKNDPI